MPSVLESLGIIKQDAYTSVPQLGVTNDLNMRQIESQKYFTVEKGAQARNGNMLAVLINEEQHFDIKRHDHLEFLNKCTALVKEKSAQLKAIDQKLLVSVALSVTATALSFLPVIGWLGWIGWGASIYYITQRATAYAEYQESLKLLVGACNWSLGEGPAEDEDSEARKDVIKKLTEHDSIRNMMAVLYPVLTKTQVEHLIADDSEEVFTKELDEYEKKFKLGFDANRFFSKHDDRIALSKKGAEFNRCIYGFNKGGATDFLDAILSIIPDLYRAAAHGLQQLKYKWQEKNHSSTSSNEEVENSLNMKL
jgi:hypothetical protein